MISPFDFLFSCLGSFLAKLSIINRWDNKVVNLCNREDSFKSLIVTLQTMNYNHRHAVACVCFSDWLLVVRECHVWMCRMQKMPETSTDCTLFGLTLYLMYQRISSEISRLYLWRCRYKVPPTCIYEAVFPLASQTLKSFTVRANGARLRRKDLEARGEAERDGAWFIFALSSWRIPEIVRFITFH